MPTQDEISTYVIVYDAQDRDGFPARVYQRKADDHFMIVGTTPVAQFKDIDTARQAMALFEALKNNPRLSFNEAIERVST